MLKDFFRFTLEGSTAKTEAPGSSEETAHATGFAELAAALDQSCSGADAGQAKATLFEQVYQNAAVKPPRMRYGIIKVAEMLESRHLTGLSLEAKRSALLMALDAAGTEIEDVLQDAVVRQRALNDHEEAMQKHLKEFEAGKAAQNATIQAELDRITREHMSLIQANLDEVAREQDRLRNWQRMKQDESQRIADAAAVCVPHGGPSNVGLSQVLERATASRR